MLSSIINCLIKRPKQSRYAEDLIYDTNNVYVLYCIVRNNFNYCMRNKLLTRSNILKFKSLLNKSVNLKEFKFDAYENDAHEIYSKLKSKSISKKNMLKLNNFLEHFITVQPKVEDKPSANNTYGNLTVIK